MNAVCGRVDTARQDPVSTIFIQSTGNMSLEVKTLTISVKLPQGEPLKLKVKKVVTVSYAFHHELLGLFTQQRTIF